MDMAALLPEEVKGWRQSKADARFGRDTIFDYMNGAGEIYLAYAFKKLLVREYSHSSGNQIVAEIYDMSASSEAFGIFTHDTDGTRVNLGRDAIYSAGLIRFWQDRFFIRLLAERETDESKVAVTEMAEYIAGKIPGQGSRPKLLRCLDRRNLIPDEIRYFHKYISLNIHYYLTDSNILDLDQHTEVILARFATGSGKPRLLLIRYPTPQASRKAFNRFAEQYLGEGASGNDSDFIVKKIEGDEPVGARLLESFFILVFDAPDEATIRSLTTRTEIKIKEFLNE